MSRPTIRVARTVAAYDFICNYWREYGIAPSRDEIAQAIGITRHTSLTVSHPVTKRDFSLVAL